MSSMKSGSRDQFLPGARRRLSAVLTTLGERLDPDRASRGAESHVESASGAASTAAETQTFHYPTVEDRDLQSNIDWNRQRWGQASGWTQRDHYGYRWSDGYQHTSGSVAANMDKLLRPYMLSHELDILEIAPGAGRITAELIRYARSMCLIDLNAEAIEICRDRFKYYPTPIEYIVNDGVSLAGADGPFDFVASYDSLVHVRPEIIRGYLDQIVPRLREGGRVWIDHSGKGLEPRAHRTETTAEMVAGWASELGLTVIDQVYRNSWDCITVFEKGSVGASSAPTAIQEHPE